MQHQWSCGAALLNADQHNNSSEVGFYLFWNGRGSRLLVKVWYKNVRGSLQTVAEATCQHGHWGTNLNPKCVSTVLFPHLWADPQNGSTETFRNLHHASIAVWNESSTFGNFRGSGSFASRNVLRFNVSRELVHFISMQVHVATSAVRFV